MIDPIKQLASLRHEIEWRMGRECDMPLEQCLACQRKLRYQAAALAIVDLAEGLLDADGTGVALHVIHDGMGKIIDLLEKL